MSLYRNTVSDLLWETLIKLMNTEEFQAFRLVGGTSLSLQIGHRASVDINLFTDVDYGSIDFNRLDTKIRELFPFVQPDTIQNQIGMGTSYFVGTDVENLIKLDIFYTDNFVFPLHESDNIRLAAIEEIIAMKLEIIGNKGRKKDFWDIHELLNSYSLDQMLEFYIKRHPYGHTKEELLQKLIDFSEADHDFDPICYKGKIWELIKQDFQNLIK